MQTAVITGASKGIGSALAETLWKSQQDWQVINISRTRGAFDKNDFPHYHHIPADLTDESEITQTAAHVAKNYPSIDLLVNNAGSICSDEILGEISPKTLSSSYCLHVIVARHHS